MDFVWSELPMAEGYCYIAVAEELDGWIQLGDSQMVGGGYVGEEVRRLMQKNP